MASRYLPLLAIVLSTGCMPLVLWHGRSLDRRVAVEVEQRLGSQRVVIEGQPGERYLSVGFEELVISPDGQRVAYPARIGRQWVMVVQSRNGEQRSRPWDGLAETTWSGDGRHLVYAAQRRDRWQVVLDGEVGRAWDRLQSDSLTLSNDGARLLYVAIQRDEAYLVIDGRVLGPYDEISEVIVSSDGAHTGFIAREGEEQIVSIDERSIGSPSTSASSLMFNGDGSSWAYIDRRGDDESCVVRDGRDGPPLSAIVADSLSFSPGGRHLAYVGRAHGSFVVVYDDKTGPAFDEVEGPVFGSGDEQWGYLGRWGGMTRVVINGRQVRKERWAGGLQLSPTDDEFVYVAEREEQTVIVHPSGVASFDVVVVDSLAFSPDGRHWACLVGDASTREAFVTIDGVRRRPFDLDELVDVQMQQPSVSSRVTVGSRFISTMVRAELALALRQ